MAFNRDELLTINDKDSFTYAEGHPGAGTPQAIFGQDRPAGPELAMFYKNYRGTDLQHLQRRRLGNRELPPRRLRRAAG